MACRISALLDGGIITYSGPAARRDTERELGQQQERQFSPAHSYIVGKL